MVVSGSRSARAGGSESPSCHYSLRMLAKQVAGSIPWTWVLFGRATTWTLRVLSAPP